MKSIFRVIVISLSFFQAGGLANAEEPQTLFIPSGDAQRGRDVFVEKGCRTCHAVRGAGGRRGPDLAAALVHRGVLGIGAGMWSHAPGMSRAMRDRGKDFPRLAPDDVKDLLAYLLFIGFTREPGDPVRGRAVFTSKGCVTCHALGGPNEAAGASPANMSRVRFPIAVAQAMWNHGLPMDGEAAKRRTKGTSFADDEMADLIAFLEGSEGSGELPVDLPGRPAAGKSLFASKGCAVCHIAGNEAPVAGPDLSSADWYKTSTGLAAAMWNHEAISGELASKEAIEVFRMRGSEMADVVAYLYVLRSGERTGDAEQGGAVFVLKGCAGCHSGGGPGPDLARSAALSSPSHFGSAMWNHAPQMLEAMESKGLQWPELTGEDVANLMAFLFEGKQIAGRVEETAP